MIYHLTIPQYLLESSFCLAVFYLFYKVFLKKETYFQFNRFYLLGTAVVALLIPIINIDFNKASHISGAEQMFPIINQLNDIQIGFQQTIAQESNILHISISDIINFAYMAGFFIMTLKLCTGLFKLFGIINRSPKLKDNNHTLLISNDVPAASFFSYVFWNDNHDKSDPIQKTIMDHEMVHVRQWHSLDVIVMEILVIVKWFNPLIYLFRNSLKKTHEFIADQYVTDQIGDKVKYASILIANSTTTTTPSLSNPFYGNVKERIEMLSTKKSKWFQSVKYFALLPITVLLFSLFSFDLSDRLPQPIKSSLQSIEHTMLAAIETNVITLDIEEEKEKNAFHLGWKDIINIKLNQTYQVQDFIFYYSKEDLSDLLASEPNISQNGKHMEIYIDTLEVITSSGKKEISLESLKDDEFRNFFIDSLDKFDQIMLGLKTYSETDSLFIKLHIGLEESSFQKVNKKIVSNDKTIRWGQRKFKFSADHARNQNKLSVDNSMTDEDLIHMLDNRLEISFDSKNYELIPEDVNISFNVKRASNPKLAREDSKKHRNLEKGNNPLKEIVYIRTDYHGKKYNILEESQFYTLSEFYNKLESFTDWITSCQNGDLIRINIVDPNKNIGNYEFNLRYRNDNEAISAPFPIDLPNTSNTYSDFQIVMNDGGKSYVRIDTKDRRNKRIVDAYKGSESYEIIHIDNFKTKSRIKEVTLPSGILQVEDKYHSEINDLNILSLNDYYSDEDQLIRMDWGKMVSMPNIGNFSIKEFKRSSKEHLTLFVGTEDIEMARFDLVIIPENGKIKRIRTDNVKTQSIREILNELDGNTSIYIDNIIVDVEDDLMYYPFTFVFTVE